MVSVPAPEGATEDQINPQPIIWPQCECGAAFVLRRGLSFTSGAWSWYWQKDCKHDRRKPQPGYVIVNADGPVPT